MTRDTQLTRTRKHLAFMFVLALVVAFGGGRAWAATAFWHGQGATTDWSDADNWDTDTSVDAGSYTPANNDNLRWYLNTGPLTMNNDLTLSVGTVSFQGADGTLTLDGNKVTLTGGVTRGPDAGSSVTIKMPLELNVATAIFGDATAAQPILIEGIISETGGSRNLIVRNSPFILNGANTFSGEMQLGYISGTATVTINTLANIGVAQSLGTGTLVQFGNHSDSGDLIYTGGSTSTNKSFQLGENSNRVDYTAAGSFANDGAGAVTWTGSQTLSPTATVARTFALGGTNTGDNTWQSAIADNSALGIINLSKTGVGTWILSGDNTYTGLTAITEGTLVINGDQSLATGTVTVSSEAAIGGNGTIGGDLTLASGAQFWFDPDYTLTIDGTTANLGDLSITDILNLDASVADGTYTLLDGTASFITTGVGNWGIGNAYDFGVDGKIAYFTGGSLSLVVETVVIPEPTSIGLLGLLVVSLTSRGSLTRRRSRRQG